MDLFVRSYDGRTVCEYRCTFLLSRLCSTELLFSSLTYLHTETCVEDSPLFQFRLLDFHEDIPDEREGDFLNGVN